MDNCSSCNKTEQQVICYDCEFSSCHNCVMEYWYDELEFGGSPTCPNCKRNVIGTIDREKYVQGKLTKNGLSYFIQMKDLERKIEVFYIRF